MPAPFSAALCAAREGAAWCRLPNLAFISVKGKGRPNFLHGLLSADIKKVEPGTGVPACLLTAKGALVAPLGVHHLEEEHLLVGPAGAIPKAFEMLAKMAPLSDCEVELSERKAWLVAGPHKARIVEGVAGRPSDPGPGGTRTLMTSAGAVELVADFHTGLDAYLLVVPAAAAERFEGVLEGAVEGAVELPAAALEALRVELGVPAWGVEATAECFPQEVRLDSWVAHDKGCYLGQEMMARLRDRGHVNRLLVGLTLGEPAAPGDPIEAADGLKVGSLTSVAPSEKGILALGFVRRDALGGVTAFNVWAGPKKVRADLRELS